MPQKAESGPDGPPPCGQAVLKKPGRRCPYLICYVRIYLVLVDRVDVIDRFVVGGLLALGRV